MSPAGQSGSHVFPEWTTNTRDGLSYYNERSPHERETVGQSVDQHCERATLSSLNEASH